MTVLPEGLAGLPGLTLDPKTVQTNMLFAAMDPARVDALVQHLKGQGIVILPNPSLRLVTHLDVNKEDVQKTITTFKAFFR